MYIEPMMRIGRIENGFLIELEMPYKEEGPSDRPCSYEERCKTFSVASVEEAVEKIGMLLPKIATSKDADVEFSAAFEAAMKPSRG